MAGKQIRRTALRKEAESLHFRQGNVVQRAVRGNEFKFLFKNVCARADDHFGRLPVEAIQKSAFGGTGTQSGFPRLSWRRSRTEIAEIFMIVSNNFAVIVSLAQ